MRNTVHANPLVTELNRRRAQEPQRPPDRLLSLQGPQLQPLLHLLIQTAGKHGPLQVGVVIGLLGHIGGLGRLPPFALLGAGRHLTHHLLQLRHLWVI
jgi:hypothetical protein